MRGVVGLLEFCRFSLFGLMLLGPALAGCSSSMLPSMPMSVSSMFGSSKSAANANAAATTGAALPTDFECPDVTVRQGAATLTSSADPAEPTALNLRYQ